MERVVFVSAKQKFLDVERLTSEDFLGNDFNDELSLYRAILILSDAASEDIENLNLEDLKRAVNNLFDTTSIFIVIDDIDTLTTAGEEAGIDFLYRVASRAKKSSKILYTLRNRPSHSLKSSIEVSGMESDELIQFVTAICEQIGIDRRPSDEFITGRLSEVSEGRPLVVESILQLRRRASSDEKAIDLFERHASNVREYVFQREWDAIDAKSKGREILACLALYGKPMSFDDLVNILRVDESNVLNAIQSVQEMFLSTEAEGRDALYSLSSLTFDFVSSAASKLDYIATIRARVEHFRRSAYPESPMLARLHRDLNKAEIAWRRGDASLANDLYWRMSGERFSASEVENPRFLALRAYAASLCYPPKLAEMRDDFRSALSMGFAPPIGFMQRWFEAERSTDSAFEGTREVFQLVENERRYSLSERSAMKMARAIAVFQQFRNVQYIEPRRAVTYLENSLRLHLEAFAGLSRSKSPLATNSGRHSRNTGYSFSQKTISENDADRFIDFVNTESLNPQSVLDPMVSPIEEFLNFQLRKNSKDVPALTKSSSKISHFRKNILAKANFHDRDLRNELDDMLKGFEEASLEAIAKARSAKRGA